MKRFLHRLSLLFVVLLLLTTAVFADMGPKPQLTVVVEHAPSELYYLDLLAEGEYEYDPDFAMDETDLDPELLPHSAPRSLTDGTPASPRAQPALRSGGNSPATLPDPRIITASAITASQRHTAF